MILASFRDFVYQTRTRTWTWTWTRTRTRTRTRTWTRTWTRTRTRTCTIFVWLIVGSYLGPLLQCHLQFVEQVQALGIAAVSVECLVADLLLPLDDLA